MDEHMDTRPSFNECHQTALIVEEALALSTRVKALSGSEGYELTKEWVLALPDDTLPSVHAILHDMKKMTP